MRTERGWGSAWRSRSSHSRFSALHPSHDRRDLHGTRSRWLPLQQSFSRLQARLEDLCAQQAELSPATPDEAGHGPTPADLAAVADQLEHVIAECEPQKTKALLRLLIQELRVEGRARIQPTYRLVTPEVCATSEKVEPTGIEPVKLRLQSHEDAGFDGAPLAPRSHQRRLSGQHTSGRGK